MISIQERLQNALIQKIERIRDVPGYVGGHLMGGFQANLDAHHNVVSIYAQIGWETYLNLRIKYNPSSSMDVYIIGKPVAQAMVNATEWYRPTRGNHTAMCAGLRLTTFSDPGEVLATVNYNDGASVEALIAFVDSLLDDAYATYVHKSEGTSA